MAEKENNRKCFKCGCSPAADNIKLFRFPKPAVRNLVRSQLWAKYIFPERDYSSITLQTKLHSEHRMLCQKHFNDEDFTDESKQRLLRSAVPCDENSQKSEIKRCVIDPYGNNENVKLVASSCNSNDKADDNIDDGISQPKLFSWQKDSEVNCDDLNYDSDIPIVQKTTCKQDSNGEQTEYCDRQKNCVEQCPTTVDSTISDERKDLHEGYKCDMCKGPIYKFRYTCVQCVNYDQCVACEGGAAHQQHYMLRVPTHRPYGEIQLVMDTIRHILSADIKSFQTEANFATNILDEMKSEVTSEAGTDLCPEEEDLPITTNDISHEDDVEMCSYSKPLANSNIASHEPATQMDLIMYDKATSTAQSHKDYAVDDNDSDIDWLDEDILEECEMSQSSITTENVGKNDLNSQLKPGRLKQNIDNLMSLSKASGKVNRLIYEVINIPQIASNSTTDIT